MTCVIWSGLTDRDGYARDGIELVHRSVYMEVNGPIPAGYDIDHTCRNRACVNPDHLQAVTHAENMRRRSEAQTHCVNGHPFSAENTYNRPASARGGRRNCRACNREAQRRYKQRKSA